MRKVGPGDPDYDKDRAISNARFDYRPWAIYYCDNAQDVARAIADARAHGGGVRIRSGGHQHEGMCSADGVLLIDLSSIDTFGWLEEKEGRVWIGAGAALADVYVELWRRGYYFPGGACGDVHVGGLTQGGGWGLGARRFGLTCDSLVGVEIVTADGKIRKVLDTGADEDRGLLQALRGAGGGNFGVITRFCFRLHPWRLQYTDVSLTWGDDQLPGNSLDGLLMHWLKTFPNDRDDKLTTFMRLLVAPFGNSDRLLLSGRYLGTTVETESAVNRILKGFPAPRVTTYTSSPPRPKKAGVLRLVASQRDEWRRQMGTHLGYQPGPSPQGAAPGASPDLTSTCAGIPFRHKISSGFVRQPLNPKLAPVLTDVIRKTRPIPPTLARQYVSLHSLGGAVSTERLPSAYAFRDRSVLLQYQAWWQSDAAPLDRQCIAWIESFREAMAPYTDGAFINFVDRDVPLAQYYQHKLPGLVEVKRRWDPDNWFKFGMSIPTKLAPAPPNGERPRARASPRPTRRA